MELGDHGQVGLAVSHAEQARTLEQGHVTVPQCPMEEQTVWEVELTPKRAT